MTSLFQTFFFFPTQPECINKKETLPVALLLFFHSEDLICGNYCNLNLIFNKVLSLLLSY